MVFLRGSTHPCPPHAAGERLAAFLRQRKMRSGALYIADTSTSHSSSPLGGPIDSVLREFESSRPGHACSESRDCRGARKTARISGGCLPNQGRRLETGTNGHPGPLSSYESRQPK